MDYQEYPAEEHLIDVLLLYLLIFKNRITTMGKLFVHDNIADPSILSADSSLIKAKGSVWHKSAMGEGVVPRSGIDTDAR